MTPYDAYRAGLVKRIEVASVLEDDASGMPYLRLVDVMTQKRTVTAKVAIHKLMKTGAISEKVVTIKPGDSLADKAERPEYGALVVEEINPSGGFVRFTNGVEVQRGEAHGADRESLFRAQIRYTVGEHFRKQEKLRGAGLKVLSLFFIDRVANYVPKDGLIRRLFVEAFDGLKGNYPDWRDLDAATVQAAYFAQKRRKEGAVEVMDSSSGKAAEDKAAYALIMRDKERLLSFSDPVAFIFSHSALREGWDNPNVFQICTLNQSGSEVRKRQEIGRGMRLAVNQDGQRTREERQNILTVVANESYQHYVATLQAEVAAEYGNSEAAPPPANARKRGEARLRKEYLLTPEFTELWQRIGQKTRYKVHVDTAALLDAALPAIDQLQVDRERITIQKGQVTAGSSDVFEALTLSGAKTVSDLTGRYPVPNLIDLMAHLMAHTMPSMFLTRKTLLMVYERTTNQQAVLDNPQEFASGAVRILTHALTEQMVGGIKYERLNDWYSMELFAEEILGWADNLIPAEGALYDQVICDSQIERAFVEGLEWRNDVKLYVKLPAWFTVQTPIGEYNPDWAIVMEDRDEHGDGRERLYLVRETKSTIDRGKLRTDERHKIYCVEQHFVGALGVSYRVVTNAAELPYQISHSKRHRSIGKYYDNARLRTIGLNLRQFDRRVPRSGRSARRSSRWDSR